MMKYDVVKSLVRVPGPEPVLDVRTCPDRGSALTLAREWALSDARAVRSGQVRVKVVQSP